MDRTQLFIDFQDDLFSNEHAEQAMNHAYMCDTGDGVLNDFDACFDASNPKWQDFLNSGNLWSLADYDLPSTEEREKRLHGIVSDEYNKVSAESSDLDDLKSKLPALRESLQNTMAGLWSEYEAEENGIAERLHGMAKAAAGSA